MNAEWIKDAAKAGVFHLSADARELARAAAAAGLMVVYVDIHRAHDKEDFLAEVSLALRFPENAACAGLAHACPVARGRETAARAAHSPATAR